MSKILTITNWDQTFENADTRKRQRLGWFLAPSGCDSRGYVALISRFPQDKAMMAMGIFQALCQLSATLGKGVRGTFKNSDGTPMAESQISVLLRVDACHLSAALEVLCSEEVKWCFWQEENGQHATSMPPACQSPPGFVKGEGEGEGEGTLVQGAVGIASLWPKQSGNDAETLTAIAASTDPIEKIRDGTKRIAAAVREAGLVANAKTPNKQTFFTKNQWRLTPEEFMSRYENTTNGHRNTTAEQSRHNAISEWND